MNAQENKIRIKIEVKVYAPIIVVWEAWTAPQHITQWYFASNDWHAPYAENDLHIGGKFKTRMAAKDGSAGFDYEGVYLNIKYHDMIEYELGDGRNVITTFHKDEEESTVITQTFEVENINSTELQQKGWQNILNNFKFFVEDNWDY